MQHILFISYDGMTDPLGQSQVIPYLAGLTKYGYRFTILSSEKKEAFMRNRNDVLAMLNGLPIQWNSIIYHKSPPVISGMYDLQLMQNRIRKIMKDDPVVMVHTRPGIPALLGIWMKKKYGVRFLNDIRGFWADERVDGGMWNLKNPLFASIYRFFRKKEIEALEIADGHVCLTHAAEKEIRSWKKIPNAVSLQVIPCSTDLLLFNPEQKQRSSWINKLAIPANAPVISYLGSIGGWYLTDEMLRCCKAIYDRHPKTIFLFISNNRHEWIMASAQRAGIPENNIRTIQAKRTEVPELLNLSTYSLFFIKPCYSKISSSPTKLAEIMAMGIPVISNAGVGDVESIILDNQAGYIVSGFSDTDFLALAKQLDFSRSDEQQARIRRAASDHFSLDHAIHDYAGLYSRILH